MKDLLAIYVLIRVKIEMRENILIKSCKEQENIYDQKTSV
jgi:hypothetical protein